MSPEDLEKVRRYIDPKIGADERSGIWIEMADAQISREYFGSSYHLAVALFASHIGSLLSRDDGSEVGSLTSKSEGGISISYSPAGGGTDDDLLATNFGRQFLNLRNSLRFNLLTGSFAFGMRCC